LPPEIKSDGELDPHAALSMRLINRRRSRAQRKLTDSRRLPQIE
jgi:hypothetical protein